MTTDGDYKARLSPLAYRVTRENGTERAFTGDYWDHHEPGTYACVCCGVRLFDSAHKFDSKTGWPSFTQVAEGAPIEERRDESHGMVRVDVRCRSCNAHLGHVFDDGPAPTGLRYCINSAALRFEGASPS